MVMPIIENGHVAPGQVILFVTASGTTSVLEAGQPFQMPSEVCSAMVLSLNEEVVLPGDQPKRIKNMGGYAMLNGHVPAQLFPEFG